MALVASCFALETTTTKPCLDSISEATSRSPIDYVVDYGPVALGVLAAGILVWALVQHRTWTAFGISLCLALGFLLF